MKRGRKTPAPPKAPASLPRARLIPSLDAVADEYARFVADPEADAKAFTIRHDAARTALAHLTELAAIATGDSSPEGLEATTDEVLGRARARMAAETPPAETSRSENKT
jgi:hypothetical protein